MIVAELIAELQAQNPQAVVVIGPGYRTDAPYRLLDDVDAGSLVLEMHRPTRFIVANSQTHAGKPAVCLWPKDNT